MFSGGKGAALNVVLGAGIGMLALLLTYGSAIGIGFTIFILICIGAMLLSAFLHDTKPVARNQIMLIPLVFCAFMLAVRVDENLVYLNLIAGSAALILWLDYFNVGNLLRLPVMGYPARVLGGGALLLGQTVVEVTESIRWVGSVRRVFRGAGPVARGALLTIPAVAGFLVLFGSADQVFGNAIASVIRTFLPQNLFDLTIRTLYAAFFGWLAIGALSFGLLDGKRKHYRVPKVNRNAASVPETTDTTEGTADDAEAVLRDGMITVPGYRLGFTETVMLLGGLCATFGLFIAFQFVYFFGGDRNLTDFSYADYARRGFLELVVVGVLTLAVGLWLDKVATRSTRSRERLFGGLLTALIAMTGVVLVSAFTRLRLYESAYGFTVTRLNVYLMIIALGALLIGFVLSLYWRPLHMDVFGTTVMLVGFGGVFALNLLNPDAFVARQNIARGDIDPLYLATLSIEATPELVQLVNSPEPGLRMVIRQVLQRQERTLDSMREGADWRAWNMALVNADAALATVSRVLNDPALDAVPSRSRAEFAGWLRLGQSTREVVRRFGTPVSYGGSSRDLVPQRAVSMTYYIATTESLQLTFSPTRGLETACFRDLQASECLELQARE